MNALKALALLSKVAGVVVGLGIAGIGMLVGALNVNIVVLVLSPVAGLFIGLTIYAGGEFIDMLLRMEARQANIAVSASVGKNALVRMYVDSKRRKEG